MALPAFSAFALFLYRPGDILAIKTGIHLQQKGRDGCLFVFEAPIDLLSYLTLYPEDWNEHSYVACCGTSPIPVLTMLQRMNTPQAVYLCLDNDRAGHEASLRMAEQIGEQFHIASDRLIPER